MSIKTIQRNEMFVNIVESIHRSTLFVIEPLPVKHDTEFPTVSFDDTLIFCCYSKFDVWRKPIVM